MNALCSLKARTMTISSFACKLGPWSLLSFLDLSDVQKGLKIVDCEWDLKA